MAKAARKKRRRRTAQRGGSAAAKRPKATKALRRLDAPLREWRFEPGASRRAVAAVVVLSLGGVALGAGVYGQWLRDEALGPSPAAPYLLAGGLLLAAVYALVSGTVVRAFRIGDLGLGFESAAGTPQRVPWYAVRAISCRNGLVRVESDERPIALELAEHGPAIRRLLAEAMSRVPEAVEIDDEDRSRLGTPDEGEAEPVIVDPPQVTGKRCMSTDEPLTFEKDVRMCARCGALYHKSGVPQECVRCGTSLRG